MVGPPPFLLPRHDPPSLRCLVFLLLGQPQLLLPWNPKLGSGETGGREKGGRRANRWNLLIPGDCHLSRAASARCHCRR